MSPSSEERVDPDRVDPDRVDPDRVDPDRVDPDRVDPDPADLDRAQNDLTFVLEALPSLLSLARRRVANWLAALDWPAVAAEDIVLAVNEAVANVIDHAYFDNAPGRVLVHGSIMPDVADSGETLVRRVRVSIADDGRWDPQRRTVDHGGFRGHGMSVMAACMDEVHLHRNRDGTTVELVSPAVPRDQCQGDEWFRPLSGGRLPQSR